MKKILLLIAATGLLTLGCDRFHVSDNGKLDGFWKLTDVDTLSNGRSANVGHLQIFWAVQADLLEIRDIRGMNVNVFFRFDFNDKQLTLYSPVADNREISDSLVTDVNTIRPYGLSNLRETLQILELSSTKMTLESHTLRMYFRKY